MENMVFDLEKKNLLNRLKMDFGKNIPIHETQIYSELIKVINSELPVHIDYREKTNFVNSEFIYQNTLTEDGNITLTFKVSLHKECTEVDVADFLIGQLENVIHEIGFLGSIESLIARLLAEVLDLDAMEFYFIKKLPSDNDNTYLIEVAVTRFF